MAEPGERDSVTWGFLIGSFVALFFTFGVILARGFDRAYARALGISMLFANAILAAPLAKLHNSGSV